MIIITECPTGYGRSNEQQTANGSPLYENRTHAANLVLFLFLSVQNLFHAERNSEQQFYACLYGNVAKNIFNSKIVDIYQRL